MVIRPATEADLPAIVAMSVCFYETTSYLGFAPFDPDAAEDLALAMMKDGVMLVADAQGVVGMVGLMVVPFMFNPSKRVAYEVVWWVNPEAQGLGAGKALLAAIEPACRERGCAAIQMVHLSSSPPQAAALYERMGFAHTESSYTKELL